MFSRQLPRLMCSVVQGSTDAHVVCTFVGDAWMSNCMQYCKLYDVVRPCLPFLRCVVLAAVWVEAVLSWSGGC